MLVVVSTSALSENSTYYAELLVKELNNRHVTLLIHAGHVRLKSTLLRLTMLTITDNSRENEDNIRGFQCGQK